MSPEEPFPPALPAVVPSPIGPAISYSNIRAVTSRAERTLNQLDGKIRKRLQGQINDSGMVGAVAESKVRQRLASQIAPAENLFTDTVDLVQNQIAGNLAPAVATLEDLQGDPESAQRASVPAQTAVVGTPGAVASSPPAVQTLTQIPPQRATGLARQLRRAAGSVAGGSPISPLAQSCANPPDAAIIATQNAMVAYSAAHPNPPLPIAFHYYLDPNCCVFTLGEGQETSPLKACSTDLGIVTMTASDAPVVLDLIVTTLRQNGVQAATGNCTASCAPTGGVDCKVTPLDPLCPPDCKTHPEDHRCPPPTTTCPEPCSPPCIEVNVPPCPPCPPLVPESCIQIDLCDWDKFCDFIKKCIIDAKKDCALDNEAAYMFNDCDGTFGSALRGTMGSLDGGSLSVNDMEELATNSIAQIASLDSTQFPKLFII